MSPISPEAHRELSRSLPPLDDAIPLTRPRRPPSGELKPRLEVVGSGTDLASALGALSATEPRARENRPRQPRLEVVEPSPEEPVIATKRSPARAAPRLEVVETPAPETAARSEAPARHEVAYLDTVPETPALTVNDVAGAVPLTERRPSTTERSGRRHQRFPLKVEVSYTSDHNFYTGFMQNIGEGGLFVATHSPVTIGDLIEVTFSVPGMDRTCNATCRVRWLREYNPACPDSIPGMGLQFAQLEPEVRAAIELFIRHREPIFYDD